MMLRRAFFQGVAAAVGGLFAGGWLLGREKSRCRCGLLADEHPGFWKSQVKPYKESTLEDYKRAMRSVEQQLDCGVRDPVYFLDRNGMWTLRGPDPGRIAVITRTPR